jgi:hypothetical protein
MKKQRGDWRSENIDWVNVEDAKGANRTQCNTKVRKRGTDDQKRKEKGSFLHYPRGNGVLQEETTKGSVI